MHVICGAISSSYSSDYSCPTWQASGELYATILRVHLFYYAILTTPVIHAFILFIQTERDTQTERRVSFDMHRFQNWKIK